MEEALKKEELDEILNDFIFESKELIENAINETLKLENEPDDEIVNSVFRAIHTLKGTSSFLGFNTLSTLAHKTEDLLGKLRKKELQPTPEVINVLLEAMDSLKIMIDDIKEMGKDERNIDPIVEMIEALLNGNSEKKKKIGELLVEENLLTVDELHDMLEKQKKEPHKKLGEIVLEEKLVTEEQLNGFLSKQKRTKEEQFIRIDVKKLDELMDLVGELTLGKNRLIMIENTLKTNQGNNVNLDLLTDCVSYIESITNELQTSVMKTRLVPLSKIFNKVPRMVRDLSREFNKEIDLSIEGEHTELDRSLVESLENPLVHIIRNCVDHGIESPQEREKKGKKLKGLISIKAFNEGGHVVLEIFDDGKGIDVEALKQKVKEKGLLSEKELETLSPMEALDLIFIPGLSTAKNLSSVSGRGVGMDVVKTNIQKMNGNIQVESEKDKGTKIIIRLPLTLAIMRALVFEVVGETFAIPIHSVLEIVKFNKDYLRNMDKREVFLLRDRIIPLLDPAMIFFGTKKEEKGYVIICHTGDKNVGVKVDNIMGQEEIVIKSLGAFLKGIEGISGATIRGDGKVILIIDLNGLMGSHRIRNIQSKDD